VLSGSGGVIGCSCSCGGRGSVAPPGAGCALGDGTQRSRAGLSSDGPPGLGPRLWTARGCQGVSGLNPVLLREFSIPIPMPIPIPTRAARGCREVPRPSRACRAGRLGTTNGSVAMEAGLTGKVAFGVSFRSPFSSAWKRLRDARNGDEDVETPFFADLVQASPWVHSCDEVTPGWRERWPGVRT
jgi:hypothetical protein